MTPTVSVLLLTKNGMRDLPDLWEQLSTQACNFAFETVVVDSGSQDGTLEFLEARVDRLARVEPRSFEHGRTRNYGISLCRGSFVVLLVQDAIPSSAHWLAELVAPLHEDPKIAGSFARQEPRPEASALTRHYLAQWVAAGTTPRRVFLENSTQFEQMAPAERLVTCAFDNVSSCVRKSVWEQIPFPQVPIAEDVAWAKKVLLAGHHLVFVPRASVVHSHDRSASYELKRTFLSHQQLFRLFGLRTINSPRELGWAVASSLRLHLRCLGLESSRKGSRRRLSRSLALALAWPIGQYLGALSMKQGWPTSRLPGV